MPASQTSPVTNLTQADRIRLPLRFDADGLQTDCARLEEADWIAHFVEQNYEGAWSIFPLRAPVGTSHPILMATANIGDEFVDAPWLSRFPALAEALGRFECQLYSARLMRLDPGSRIKPHSDPDLDLAAGTIRLHVPVTTNPDVDFRLNGRRVDMAPGETWFLRLSDVHEITNAGSTPRIHLVIDCQVNDWLVEQLVSGIQAQESSQPRPCPSAVDSR